MDGVGDTFPWLLEGRTLTSTIEPEGRVVRINPHRDGPHSGHGIHKGCLTNWDFHIACDVSCRRVRIISAGSVLWKTEVKKEKVMVIAIHLLGTMNQNSTRLSCHLHRWSPRLYAYKTSQDLKAGRFWWLDELAPVSSVTPHIFNDMPCIPIDTSYPELGNLICGRVCMYSMGTQAETATWKSLNQISMHRLTL